MRILIVKLSSIGDVVHALPAAALIRRGLPDAHITWVVERRAGEILKDSPAIDEMVEIDTRAWRAQMLSAATLDEVRARLGHLRGQQGANGGGTGIDIAIDFQGLLKSGLVAKVSGAARRIGFETGELREKASRFFLTEQVVTARFRHVIDKNLALARRAITHATTDSGVNSTGSNNRYEFPITVSSEDERYVEMVISERGGGRFAIINPGGGWPTKLWSAEAFGQVADSLQNRHGLVTFITYGPGEEGLAQTVADGSRSGAAVPLASTLKQFVALARRADLFIGGDTGPLHLAAASGTPIVGIYGPTSPERNGPFDSRDITVGRCLWCRQDCHRRSCWHWECMDIPVSEVTRAAAMRLAPEAGRLERQDSESIVAPVALQASDRGGR